MIQAPPTIVLAVLTVDDGYVLQHRDDRPGVASPGQWGLFGGSVNAGETPAQAVRREIHEELALEIGDWRALWRVRYWVPFWEASVLHFVFAADVTAQWGRHVLGEGQGTGVFQLDALPQPMPAVVIALLERYDDERRRPLVSP